jgi:hypothetical protein
MKAQSIWPGTHYAWKQYRPRDFMPIDAQRVLVLKKTKEPIPGKTKDRTYVMIRILNDDGSPNERYTKEYKARAYDIIDYWDEYLATVEDDRIAEQERLKEHEERMERYRREREERDAITAVAYFIRNIHLKGIRMEQERIEREMREAREARINRMKRVMIGRGFNASKIHVGDTHVSVNMEEMERWLGFAEQTDQRRVG